MSPKNIEKGIIFRDKLKDVRKSPLSTYMDLTSGDRNPYRFFLYEFKTACLGSVPGGIGFFLRKIFYPRLFQACGNGLLIGRNVVIRHPQKIALGANVTIDDNCLIDARGAGENGLIIEADAIVNRNTMIQSKSGPVRIGKGTSIGSNSVLVSLGGVNIDESVLIAGGVYISAGAYNFANKDVPIMDQSSYTKSPITIGAGAWVGTGAIILDGITIGKGAVIGAGAVVTKDVPEHSIAVGVPARIVKRVDTVSS